MIERPYVRDLFEDPMLVGFEINGAVYSPQDVKILFSDNRRTNPETCLHNVVQQVGTGRHTYHVVCVSCQTTVSYEWVLEVGKNYQYDIDHNVWVHEPKKKS